jgi:hypothetical protein
VRLGPGEQPAVVAAVEADGDRVLVSTAEGRRRHYLATAWQFRVHDERLGRNDIAKPGGEEKPYPTVPLETFTSLLQLLTRVRERLGAVTVPTLVFTSRQDHAVAPTNSTLMMEHIGSADVEQRWLERSYHGRRWTMTFRRSWRAPPRSPAGHRRARLIPAYGERRSTASRGALRR